MDFLKIPDYVSNERFLKDFTSRCALSSEREMLALLQDARPAYSIQVGSFKLCTTTWHDEMIREEHDWKEPDWYWNFSAAMQQRYGWLFDTFKEGKVTFYLLPVVKRNIKGGAVQAAETGGDEGGAGSQQAATD